MKQRNYGIDLLKLYFSFCVALGHAHLPGFFPLLNMDYVVTLFFIMSGFFLLRSADSGKYASPWQYTMNRVCRIWPHYFAAFVILFLYTKISEGAGLVGLIRDFCRSVPEIMMVQNIGIFPEGINFPTWQLSTLIFTSHLLFALVQRDRRLAVDLICPLVAVCGFACLGQDVDIWGVAGNFVYVPLLRAAAGLSLGIFLHDPIVWLLNRLEKDPETSMSGVMSALTIGMILLLWINRHHATMILLPFVGLLICLLYPGNFWTKRLCHPVLRNLDMLSLGIYMNHVLFIRLIEHHPQLMAAMEGMPVDLIYLAAVAIFSLISVKIVDAVMIRIRMLRMRKKSSATRI